MNHQIQIIFPKNHFSNKKRCDKKREDNNIEKDIM